MSLVALLRLAGMLTGCALPGPTAPADGGVNRPPLVTVAGPSDLVGFDAEVRIQATISDPDGDPVQIRWVQIEGAPVRLEDAESASLRFRTARLEDLAPFADGPISVLALDRRAAGHVRFRVTATDGRGGEGRAEVEVRAAAANPGWPRVEQDQPTVLDLGRDQERYDWEVTFAPPRTNPGLEGADGRRPRLRIDAPGRYTARENVSGRELHLHGGPWMGTRQCARLECHPIEARGWASTKMATVLDRGLDGLLRTDYSEECLRCHTVGWNPEADNGGFDDIARAEGWQLPRRLRPGNSATLSEALRDRAGVGCEACHGPGRFYTSYSAEVCAGCHDSAPRYVNPSEWRLSPMSRLREGIAGRAECERCHTAQGFIDEMMGHQPAQETAREDDVQFELEPVTCGVCHDTHDGAAERLVRFSGPLYGQEPDDIDWGTGMICLACHHGGSQWAEEGGALLRPFVPRERSPQAMFPTLLQRRRVPHAPQGEVVRGRAGYALPGPGPIDTSPPHLTVPGGCLGCHVRVRPDAESRARGLVGGHTFAMFQGEGPARVENTEACTPCHGPLESLSRPARHDYDGDGTVEGIYQEVEGLLALARELLDEAIAETGIGDGRRRAASFSERDGSVVLVDSRGEPLGTPAAPVTLPADQERLYRLVFNYLVVVKDRSQGVHNPVLTVRLLQRTILRLAPNRVPRWYWR